MGAQMVREVASKTSDVAGDGTTTATVLAEAIFREGLKNVTAGSTPMAHQARHRQGGRDGRRASSRRSRKTVKDNKEIEQVATISANGDTAIGKIIAEAMDKVGKDGTITVEEAKSIETTLDVVEGMQFDKGYISPYFVTDKEGMEVRPRGRLHPHLREEDLQHEGPAARCSRRSRSAASRCSSSPRTSRARRSPPWSSTSCAARCRSCAVKAPGFGDRRKAMMEDIAILTGGKVDLRGPRHQARERQARGPRPGQAHHDRQGEHDDRRGRRQEAGDPGPRRADPAARSRRRPPTTIARSCRSVWPSSRAAWP